MIWSGRTNLDLTGCDLVRCLSELIFVCCPPPSHTNSTKLHHPTSCVICFPPETKTQQQDMSTTSSRRPPTGCASPTPEGDWAFVHDLLADVSTTQAQVHPWTPRYCPSSPQSAGIRIRS